MVKLKNYSGLLLVLILPLVIAARTQQTSDQHHNHQQNKRVDGVNERGDHAMGFSHEKTTHHFRLTREGGTIEVTANNPSDSETQDQIRSHLSHIAKMFKEGDFSAPMFIHDEVPPGVPAMKRLKAEVSYTFERIESGARIRIATSNADAVEAIHGFLRYQITDHQTGDPIDADKQASTGADHHCNAMKETCPFTAASRTTDK